MSLSEQRKLKNDELKRKVAQITNKEKGITNFSDTDSQISSASSKDNDFFITKTKTKKGKGSYKDKPESPTALAAKALMIMNKDPNEEALEVIKPINFSEEVQKYLTPADQVMEDVSRHEREMNQMFLELNDLEDMIKGNKDLKEMESLMGVTNETIDFHKSSFNTLKDQILSINKEAELAA